jgi:phospholipase C
MYQKIFRMPVRRNAMPIVALAAAIAGGCSGGTGSSAIPMAATASSETATMQTHAATSPITHVIIMVQENRSYDNLFATFPGGDGARYGKTKTAAGKPARIKLTQAPLAERDIGHGYPIWLKEYDGGAMDGFSKNYFASDNTPAGNFPYQYVKPSDVAPYWDIAKKYVLADELFQTQASDSFTAHQDLIAGGTKIDATQSVIDTPNGGLPWGCNSQPGTTTAVITTSGQFLPNGGPFPCFSYPTMRDRLDAAKVTWRYYTPDEENGGAIWNAFEAIKSVFVDDKPEYDRNVVTPETTIYSDITKGQLRNVSWLIPDLLHSDHPGAPDEGPSGVASVVNAVGKSKYWNSTAIVVVWDDWGGFYDHKKPAFRDDMGGLGFRVPCLIVSAYAPRAGYVDATQYEFGSILKFVEQNWSLASLGTTDVRATSIAGAFDFSKKASAFSPVPAKYSQSFFEHEPPSRKPVDDY